MVALAICFGVLLLVLLILGLYHTNPWKDEERPVRTDVRPQVSPPPPPKKYPRPLIQQYPTQSGYGGGTHQTYVQPSGGGIDWLPYAILASQHNDCSHRNEAPAADSSPSYDHGSSHHSHDSGSSYDGGGSSGVDSYDCGGGSFDSGGCGGCD